VLAVGAVRLTEEAPQGRLAERVVVAKEPEATFLALEVITRVEAVVVAFRQHFQTERAATAAPVSSSSKSPTRTLLLSLAE
jgi:hypothetical protein